MVLVENLLIGLRVRIDLEVDSGTHQVNTSVSSRLNNNKPPERGAVTHL